MSAATPSEIQSLFSIQARGSLEVESIRTLRSIKLSSLRFHQITGRPAIWMIVGTS